MGSRFAVVDDHPLFRAALVGTLATAYPEAQVGAVAELAALDDWLRADVDCDLVLLDLTVPGTSGFSGLMRLRADYPHVPVLIVSGADDPAVIRRAMAFGAAGYLPKSSSADEMIRAVAAVLAGGSYLPDDIGGAGDEPGVLRRVATLTPQQIRVLLMLSDGLMNKQIAYALAISEATVKAHVSSILQKLDVDTRTQAVILASRLARENLEALLAAEE